MPSCAGRREDAMRGWLRRHPPCRNSNPAARPARRRARHRAMAPEGKQERDFHALHNAGARSPHGQVGFSFAARRSLQVARSALGYPSRRHSISAYDWKPIDTLSPSAPQGGVATYHRPPGHHRPLDSNSDWNGAASSVLTLVILHTVLA
jgi:hypothetical protein